MRNSAYWILILITSCSFGDKPGFDKVYNNRKQMSVDELKDWEAENISELVRERKIDKYKFDLKYLPSGSDGMSVFSFVLRISSSENINLFQEPNIKFQSNDSKMMYWSSLVRNRVRLVTSRDTIPADIVIFENTGSVLKDIVLNVGFSLKSKIDENAHTEYSVIYDDEYFGLGNIIFNVSKIINETPKLKL